MATTWNRSTLVGMLAVAVLASSGCAGNLAGQGRSPVVLVVNSLQAASGARPDTFGGTLLSDVITLVEVTINGETQLVPTVFNDSGLVTLSLILKDPGQPGVTAVPSAINQVTITRYRVEYVRADGRNTPGLDVPFPFDSAVTFSVPGEGEATAGFQIVRHTAKQEAPLAALANNPDIISTIARVTFFGRDQAGNDVSATGQIGIDFGNFADPL